MNKQILNFVLILLLNRIVIQFFLLAFNERKHIKNTNFMWQKLLGTYYWQNTSIIIKFTVIVIILSYIFALYVGVIFVLSKMSIIKEDIFIRMPLWYLCIIYSLNFVLLCCKLYSH